MNIKNFHDGNASDAYKLLGAHVVDGGAGVKFSVWAPNAKAVSVIGSFNNWQRGKNCLRRENAQECGVEQSGIWTGIVPEAKLGDLYKYFIESNYNNYSVEKSDPYAFCAEVRPKTASVIHDINAAYDWGDEQWLASRENKNPIDGAINIYEMHLGSWRYFAKKSIETPNITYSEADLPPVTYRDLAETLPKYLNEMGFTHVEFMPVMEYPYDGSWGYQLTGYFAPTSRYGTPDDFKYLIDKLHQAGIGVILDIVPAHFAVDGHGLSYFDGTHLYEHQDTRLGVQPDWGTYIFNFGRGEVVSFLISHVLFWIRQYHIDGFRMDAVAAMLYLNYSRKDGEWIPNRFGGNENLEAIEFIKKLNQTVRKEFPNILMCAEESTAWPGVTDAVDNTIRHSSGLGFTLKWNMGWMTDVLSYMKEDPIFRIHHHDKLTFGMLYAYSEKFLLPFSHDEVVHGKGSLIRKLPGHEWQRFAGLRGILGYMYGYPGKKLLFMGTELGEWDEWYEKRELGWNVLGEEGVEDDAPGNLHCGVFRWVRDLNRFLLSVPALYEQDFNYEGFEWIECNDASQNIISFLRYAKNGDYIVVVCNFSSVPRYNFRIGVPSGYAFEEVLNSDLGIYGGGGVGNFDLLKISNLAYHGRQYSVELAVPPFGCVFLKPIL